MVTVPPCDVTLVSFMYLTQETLVLRASKNPHSDVVDLLEMTLDQGVTGWVAKNRQTVSLSRKGVG